MDSTIFFSPTDSELSLASMRLRSMPSRSRGRPRSPAGVTDYSIPPESPRFERPEITKMEIFPWDPAHKSLVRSREFDQRVFDRLGGIGRPESRRNARRRVLRTRLIARWTSLLADRKGGLRQSGPVCLSATRRSPGRCRFGASDTPGQCAAHPL